MQAAGPDNPGCFIMGKIDMIKLVRCCAPGGMGLKEAKDAVEAYLDKESLPLETRQAIDRIKTAIYASQWPERHLDVSRLCRLLNIKNWQVPE